MGVASLDSAIIDHKAFGLPRCFVILCLTVLFTACASKQVVVEGKFPKPLLDPLPITLGLLYPSIFAEHEFFDEAKGRAESDWLVKTGKAQVEFWDILFSGMFNDVVHLKDWETIQTRGTEIDGVLIPEIAELQYTIPTHTNVKIYEIWMRYEFRLANVSSIRQEEDGVLNFDSDDLVAAWPVTAYGKTPTAFLQTDEEAVNLAAVVALRDAGAHFVTTFGNVPDVAVWLQNIAMREQSTMNDSSVAADVETISDTSEETSVIEPSEDQPHVESEPTVREVL